MATKKKQDITAFDELIRELENKPWLSTDFKKVKQLAHNLRRKDRLQRTETSANTDLVTAEICAMRDRIADLEEHMKECASVLSWVLENARPDTDWQTFTNSVMNAMVEAESLINKAKDYEEI